MSMFNPSELLWVPDENNVYELVKIIQDHVVEPDQKEEYVIVETIDNKRTEKKFPKSATYLVDKTHIAELPDLIEMNSLHEAPLLDTLRKRWSKDSMYTNTGEILVSINPYHNIPGLYENPLKYLDLSKTNSAKSLPPHVYAIANNALRETIRTKFDDEDKVSQSIIVTGESGAGKTEASKHVMNFLTLANKETSPDNGDAAEKIKNIILDSNSIFEAFGNAKTVRNDNSSRFGKYIKLLYTADNHLWAAHTETFLLEKSRIVSVGKDDRNYHIFYQLVRGLDENSKRKLKLNNVDSFKILTSGDCTTITTEQDDINEFQTVSKALVLMGCSNEEIEKLWELLACVLHLGNVTCTKSTDENTPCALDSPTMSMEEITNYFGVQLDGFTKVLSAQVVKVKHLDEKYEKLLSAEETVNNINALIKWIYGGIFNWLVTKVNSAHQVISTVEHKSVVKFIGILDIFGFEILRTNTFEQLCINYTNERLQQQFNELAFEIEQQEYAKEGLDWKSINYRDNQPVIDLIGKKPQGLLILLEEHSLMNRDPDDQALLNTYHKHHFNLHVNYAKPRFGQESFVVKHFAGDVEYSIANFITKNNDALQEDLSDLLASSNNKLLIDILKSNSTSTNGAGGSEKSSTAVTTTTASTQASSSGGTKIASSVSVSLCFRGQLDTLVSTLRSTKAFYIKCIKPNGEKKAGVFNAPMVITQLRYSGVLEIVRIRREGYPTRVNYLDFYEEFQELAYDKKWTPPSECSFEQLKEYCNLLCTEHCPKDSFQLGHKFLFLHHYIPQVMANAVHALRRKLAIISIQSVIRMAQAKKLKKLELEALAEKRRIAMELMRRRNEAATKIQSHLRTIPAKKILIELRATKKQRDLEWASAIRMQAMARQHKEHQKYLNILKAIVLIQRIARGRIAYKKYQQQRAAAIAVEKVGRGKLARNRYQLQLKSIARLQVCSKQYLRNLHNRNLIIEFHKKCKAGDIIAAKNMIHFNNNLLSLVNSPLYRNKWSKYCTLYQSAASGGQLGLLNEFLLSPPQVLEKDIDGNRLLHFASTYPELDLMKYLCEVMSRITTTLVVNIKDDDNDDEAEEDENIHDNGDTNLVGKIDLVTGLPIIKSGWLKKSSTILGFKSWKKRYCVLTEESFVLYRQVNKKPAGYIPIEGCLVERAHGADSVMGIKKPKPSGVKKSLFSNSGEHDAYTMKGDGEEQIQEWIKAVSLAAGVRPFRDGPINHLNLGIRSAWMKMVNKNDETPLHILAQIPKSVTETRGDEAIKLAAWLIENGVCIENKNRAGKTALELATANQNVPIMTFLNQRRSVLETALNSKVLQENRISETKGFSYLQIHLEKLISIDSK